MADRAVLMSRQYTLQRAAVSRNRGIHVDYPAELKTAVKFNIPEAEAVDRLKDLIREHGKWVDPAQEAAVLEPAL
jgi:hypothetical protein